MADPKLTSKTRLWNANGSLLTQLSRASHVQRSGKGPARVFIEQHDE
ncbi:hypothetical protein [Cryobacterium sp. M15]|nr:hypothetical protein [Cryobacterium sp. M15]